MSMSIESCQNFFIGNMKNVFIFHMIMNLMLYGRIQQMGTIV